MISTATFRRNASNADIAGDNCISELFREAISQIVIEIESQLVSKFFLNQNFNSEICVKTNRDSRVDKIERSHQVSAYCNLVFSTEVEEFPGAIWRSCTDRHICRAWLSLREWLVRNNVFEKLLLLYNSCLGTVLNNFYDSNHT